MNLTLLELIVFPSMLLVFVLAVAALALWTMHSTRHSPLSPQREGLRVYRDLSPAEYALAAYRDPATVLTAAVIDLLQSGKATVTGLDPLVLGPGRRPSTDSHEQQIVAAFGMADLDERGQRLLATLEDLCDALSDRMRGHSVGLTLRHFRKRSRRVLGRATHALPPAYKPEAIDTDLPWLAAAEGVWLWVRKLETQVPPDPDSAREMLAQGESLDPNTCGQILSVLTFLCRETIRLEDVIRYLEQHGDGQYLKGKEISRMARQGLSAPCPAHPEQRAVHLCRLCRQPVCSPCFDALHRCCGACAFPHVRLEAGDILTQPSLSDCTLHDYTRRIIPGLVKLDFKPAVGSRYPAYVGFAEKCDAVFANTFGGSVDLICVGMLDAFAHREIEPFLERMYHVLARFPRPRRGSIPFGVLVLLASTPMAEWEIRDIMALRGGSRHGGITARPWVVELSAGKVHSHTHLDGMGEFTSRDLVAVLEAARHQGQ